MSKFLFAKGFSCKDVEEGRSSSTQQLGDEESSRQLLLSLSSIKPGSKPLIAIILCVAIVVLLLTAPFESIPVTPFMVVLSNTGRNLYTAGTTLLAGLIATFIAGQIKDLWILDILAATPSEQNAEPRSGSLLRRLTWQTTESRFDTPTKARSALGLSTLAEKAALWPQTLTFLIVGLITTGLVAGVDPGVYSADHDLPPVDILLYSDSACFQYSSQNQNVSVRSAWNWTLPDGTWLALKTNGNDTSRFDCDLTYAVAQRASTIDPGDGIAYIYEDIEIRPGAVPNPVIRSVRPDSLASELNNTQGSKGLYGRGQVVKGETCSPVLSGNPVTCQGKENSVYTKSDGSLVATGDGCNSTYVLGANKTANVCVNGPPGTATFVLSDVTPCNWNPATGNGNGFRLIDFITGWRSSTVLDSCADANRTNASYTVTCHIDVAAPMAFRPIRLDYLGQINGDTPQRAVDLADDPTLVPSMPSNRHLAYAASGRASPCVPSLSNGSVPAISSFLTPELLAHAAAGPWTAVAEYVDAISPHNTALWQLNYDYGAWPSFRGIFPDSHSPLEDLLGTYAGLAMSTYWDVAELYVARPEDLSEYVDAAQEIGERVADVVQFPVMTVTATRMRLGSGKWWAIVFAVPIAYAAGLLAWLCRRRVVYLRRRMMV